MAQSSQKDKDGKPPAGAGGTSNVFVWGWGRLGPDETELAEPRTHLAPTLVEALNVTTLRHVCCSNTHTFLTTCEWNICDWLHECALWFVVYVRGA